MAIFEQLVSRLLLWVLRLLGWELSTSDLQSLQAEGGTTLRLSTLSTAVQILRRRRAAARLGALLTGLARQEGATLDLLQLYRMVGPPSLFWFVEQLQASSIGNASVNTIFRITSPENPAVYADYLSFDEIPVEIHDAASGTSFRPDFNRIKVLVAVWASGNLYAAY